MKSIYNITFITLLLFLLGFLSCNDDDQPELTCQSGFEVIENSCQCPAGKIRIGEDVCRSLNENEYWATMPDSYPCRDTFLLDFSTIDSIEDYVIVNMVILNAEAYDGLIPIQSGPMRFDFKENTNRKEFYTKSDVNPHCEINGMKTGTKWEGRIQANDDIYMKMYHRSIIDVTELLDSTELVFSKELL